MLEPQDIQKLTEILATKEDIREIKEKIKVIDGSLSGVKDTIKVIDACLNGFESSFATLSTNVSSLDKRMLNLETESVNTGQRLTAIEDRLTVSEEKQDKVIDILDKISARLETLHQEYLVLKERDTRYERWFHEIADKVGIRLTP